jgi:hypothetical protein
MRHMPVLVMGLSLLPVALAAQGPAERDQPTVIYFVRHAEVDFAQPTFPLSAAGKLKAEAFAHTVGRVPFTHVFSSHTTRAREMVEPVAHARGLSVQQEPLPGSWRDTVVVSDRTSTRVAINPLVEALRRLPAGSRALVGANSDNVYALMHGLGVPAATTDRPCAEGSSCVPCLTNACASARYDQFWLLIIDPGPSVPTLIELRYGLPAEP